MVSNGEPGRAGGSNAGTRGANGARFAKLKGVESQYVSGFDFTGTGVVDSEFDRKCAMLLLGMHRWINRREETTTFTSDGNLAHRITVEVTLDDGMHLGWGKDYVSPEESAIPTTGPNAGECKVNMAAPYVVVPLMFMSGSLIHRRVADAEGCELPTVHRSEGTFIATSACWYCWNALGLKAQSSMVRWSVTHLRTLLGLNGDEGWGTVFPELCGVPENEIGRKLLQKMFDSIAGRRTGHHDDSESERNELRWRSERFADVLDLLATDGASDGPDADAFRELIHTWDDHAREGNTNGLLATVLIEALYAFVFNHPELRLTAGVARNTADATDANGGGLEDGDLSASLTTLVMLLSTVGEQFPLAALVHRDDVRPKMAFTVCFDTSYAQIEPTDGSNRGVRLLRRVFDGPVQRHLFGPWCVESIVNMTFQSYSARSSHMEIDPIDRTVIADVREYTPHGRSHAEGVDSARARRDALVASSAAGRIHFNRYLGQRRPRTKVRVTILPEKRILRYSMWWSVLLAALAGLNVIACLSGDDSLHGLYDAENLLGGLSMVFTLWVAKSLSGVNNSLSDRICGRLDEMVTKSLIAYSLSYAAVFYALGVHGTWDDDAAKGDASMGVTNMVLFWICAAFAVCMLVVTAVIAIKMVWWHHQWNQYAGRRGAVDCPNTFINGGSSRVGMVPDAVGPNDEPSGRSVLIPSERGQFDVVELLKGDSSVDGVRLIGLVDRFVERHWAGGSAR